MSYSSFYTDRRVRSFRQRKNIGVQENVVQGFAVALIVIIAPIVLWNFMTAHRDLTSAQVQYSSVVEGK